MTVFLVDDEGSVRKAVSRLLRAEGLTVQDFASAGEFLAVIGPEVRGCVVLDMAMPGSSGLQVQGELISRKCRLPVIFLTGRADVPMCAQALKRGAVDFLTKPVNDADLIAAVRSALERNRLGRLEEAEMDGIFARLATLTPREFEVLELVVAGRLNKQIAAQLGAAEKTIKVHRGRVMEKMKAESLAALVRMMEGAASYRRNGARGSHDVPRSQPL